VTRLKTKLLLQIGLFFGNWIVRLFEKVFPSFKDKNHDSPSFKSYYLTNYTLTHGEKFKRSLKLGLIISISITFWAYFTILLSSILNLSDITFHINLLMFAIILFIILVVSSLYASYKFSKK
jgi:hypothetical protein